MSLNDEKEKLTQARKWISECDVDSDHFRSSCEHLQYLLSLPISTNYDEIMALRDLAVTRIMHYAFTAGLPENIKQELKEYGAKP